jgi:RimJ/RimL family protein N-acetyltransferase
MTVTESITYSVNDPAVVRYVARQTGADDFTAHAALGVHKDGRIIGGVVYDGYTGQNIFMHVAGEGRRWLTRQFLWMAFDYPFNQLNLQRVSGLVPATNAAALRFDGHLGFREEGRMKCAARDGSDLLCLVLWRKDCQYHLKKGKNYG